MSSIMKHKLHKKMLNKGGPKIDRWGTPNKISSHELYAEFVQVQNLDICLSINLSYIFEIFDNILNCLK